MQSLHPAEIVPLKQQIVLFTLLFCTDDAHREEINVNHFMSFSERKRITAFSKMFIVIIIIPQ